MQALDMHRQQYRQLSSAQLSTLISKLSYVQPTCCLTLNSPDEQCIAGNKSDQLSFPSQKKQVIFEKKLAIVLGHRPRSRVDPDVTLLLTSAATRAPACVQACRLNISTAEDHGINTQRHTFIWAQQITQNTLFGNKEGSVL